MSSDPRGPFQSTGGGPTSAQPAAQVIPPTPLNLEKYGNLGDPQVYQQGVTSESDFNGIARSTPLNPLYFATEQTAEEVMKLLGGTGIKREDVKASVPQLMVTIPQHIMVGHKIQTVDVDYIAGLLANGLYHGDVTPLNVATLG